MRRGRKSISQTPAPLKDRVKGSKKNPKGSASSKTSALGIKLSESIINTLEKKKDEYNKDHSKKVTLNTLKAVMRRGMGAYSTSHRPTISGGAPNTRQAWGFARVNKFLLKKGGTKVKKTYVQDDDLMAKGGQITNIGTITYTENDFAQDLKLLDSIIAKNNQDSKSALKQKKLILSRLPFTTWYLDLKKGQNTFEFLGNTYEIFNETKNIVATSYRQRYFKETLWGIRSLKITNPNTHLNKYGIKTQETSIPSSQTKELLIRLINFKFERLITKEEIDVIMPKVQDDDLMAKGGEVVEGDLIKGRLYAIKGKFGGKSQFIEEVTYLGSKGNIISFSNTSYDGKIIQIITGYINEIKVYKREQGEWTLLNVKNFAHGGEMGQEITCRNCGWHWNTNDSNEYDKYICHNCGYDNKQYYMKKGGTLKKAPTLIAVAKKHKMSVAELTKPLKDGIKTEMEHTKDKATARTIALHHLDESPKYYEKLKKMEKSFKDGGEVVAHSSGKAGGVLVGRRHSQGGIKAVNKSNNQPLEMEGGEVVITRNAVSDDKKREFEGEMLTNKEILSRINESGGGVSFASGGKVRDCGCSGKKYKYGGKMMSDFDIVKSIRSASEVPMNVNKAALDMSGVKYANLKPSEAVEKIFEAVKFEDGGVLDQVGDTIRLINKRLPSLKGFMKMSRWVESPYEDDISRFSPVKVFKQTIYARGGDIKLGTITNAEAYKTYLFDNHGIKFRELPAKIQNALLMGEQKLIDNYINA